MSEGGLTPDRFASERAAAETQYDVIQSTEMQLLLDLDTHEARDQFDRVLPVMRQEHFTVRRVLTWRSKSGNTHKVVELDSPLPFETRVALQAALGSDGVKELLSLHRYLNGCIEPSMLFRPKGAKVTETE